MTVGPGRVASKSPKIVLNFGTTKYLNSYQDAAQIAGPAQVAPSIEKRALNSKNKTTIKSHTRGLPPNITFPDTKLHSVEGTYVHHHRQPS